MTQRLESFINFVHSFGAARLLLQNANKGGFLIEGLVLYAALVDGFLRIGLILKRQLTHRHTEIYENLISQESKGKFLSERQIYQLALDEDVIDAAVFKEISELYDVRNEILHKFFLTNVTYRKLEGVLERYELVYNQLKKAVYALEAEQVKQGVGMTHSEGNIGRVEHDAIMKEVFRKIGEA